MARLEGKTLKDGMWDALNKVNSKLDKGTAFVVDNVISPAAKTIENTADAATTKTKQMSTDAKKVKEDFKKVDLKNPLK